LRIRTQGQTGKQGAVRVSATNRAGDFAQVGAVAHGDGHAHWPAVILGVGEQVGATGSALGEGGGGGKQRKGEHRLEDAGGVLGGRAELWLAGLTRNAPPGRSSASVQPMRSAHARRWPGGQTAPEMRECDPRPVPGSHAGRAASPTRCLG